MYFPLKYTIALTHLCKLWVLKCPSIHDLCVCCHFSEVFLPYVLFLCQDLKKWKNGNSSNNLIGWEIFKTRVNHLIKLESDWLRLPNKGKSHLHPGLRALSQSVCSTSGGNHLSLFRVIECVTLLIPEPNELIRILVMPLKNSELKDFSMNSKCKLGYLWLVWWLILPNVGRVK